jgi:hypothetical protein
LRGLKAGEIAHHIRINKGGFPNLKNEVQQYYAKVRLLWKENIII